MTPEQVHEELRWSLATLMRDISEELYCAGWMSGNEYTLWAMVKGRDRNYGMGKVSADDVARLQRLSEHLKEWYDGSEWIPLGDWEDIYRRPPNPTDV